MLSHFVPISMDFQVAPLVQLAPAEPVTAMASAGAPVKAPITLVKRLKEAETWQVVALG